MDTKERVRLRIAREVLRLVRVRDFRAALPPEDDGISNIVVAFRDDTIKDVLDQINQVGGSAHVVVPPTDVDKFPDGMMLLHVVKSGQPVSGDTADECPVNPQSDMGMLLHLLALHDGSMSFRICHRETTVKLVDDGTSPVLC